MSKALPRRPVLTQDPKRDQLRGSVRFQKLIGVPTTTITTWILIQWTSTTAKIIITTILIMLLPNRCVFTRVPGTSCHQPVNAVDRIRTSLRRQLGRYLITRLIIHYKRQTQCFTAASSPNPSRDTQRWNEKGSKFAISTTWNRLRTTQFTKKRIYRKNRIPPMAQNPVIELSTGRPIS